MREPGRSRLRDACAREVSADTAAGLVKFGSVSSSGSSIAVAVAVADGDVGAGDDR